MECNTLPITKFIDRCRCEHVSNNPHVCYDDFMIIFIFYLCWLVFLFLSCFPVFIMGPLFYGIFSYYQSTTASIASPTTGCIGGSQVWVNYYFNTVQGQTTTCSGTSGQYPLTYTSTCNSVFSNSYPGLNPPATTMGGFVKIEQYTVRLLAPRLDLIIYQNWPTFDWPTIFFTFFLLYVLFFIFPWPSNHLIAYLLTNSSIDWTDHLTIYLFIDWLVGSFVHHTYSGSSNSRCCDWQLRITRYHLQPNWRLLFDRWNRCQPSGKIRSISTHTLIIILKYIHSLSSCPPE